MDYKVYALLNAKIKELAGGGGPTQEEVEKIVTDEVAKIVADAPEDFDTLKEMSDWISSHENSAAEMNSAIQTNANDISVLNTNKVDKVAGKSLISDAEIERLANVDNYNDSSIRADIETNATDISTLKNDSHTHTNKTVLDGITQVQLDKITTNETNISTLKDASHTHTNKTVLDGITQEQLDKIDTHNQASSTITSMTGYSKPLSTSSILESDTLNDAIGKLEKAMDGKSSTSHTHSSYVNQDAFSNVKVGDVTVAADSTTDTLTLVSGTNVTITPDATNDTITIAAKDTTYDAVTTSTSGLMSAADKTKLDGIDSGANKYTLPTASSTTLGGVKVGSNISVSSGTISISKSNVTSALGYTPISSTLKGANNGVAELDENGKVLTSQLPSYVDDVIEATALSNFPSTGEAGKIYVDTSTNKTYRWSGSGYTEISASLALGETSSTAYRGDRGKVAYDHSQATHARTDATKVEASTTNGNIKINGTETKVYTHPSGTNPHGTTKSDVGLGNVPNVATNDQTPTYTEASSLAKLTSGEKLSVAFGNI